MISKNSILLVIGAAVVLSACADVKPQVALFGTATVTAKTAESAFIDALNQKRLDQQNIQFAAYARSASFGNDAKYHWPVPLATEQTAVAVPSDSVAAINALLKPIQDYGNAMLALSTYTAPTTFAANVNNLATQSVTFEQRVLAQFGARGLPSSATLTGVAKAIGDLGNIVIQAMISRDIQQAAKTAAGPLREIVGGIKQINNVLVRSVGKGETGTLNTTAGLILTHPARYPLTLGDVLVLKTILEKNSISVTSAEADKTLDALVAANDKIAAAGIKDATAEIQIFMQAANDAYAFYSSFTSK